MRASLPLLLAACHHAPVPALEPPPAPFGTGGEPGLDAEEVAFALALTDALGAVPTIDARLCIVADRAAAATAAEGSFPSTKIPEWTWSAGVARVVATEALVAFAPRGATPDAAAWARVAAAGGGVLGPAIGLGRAPARGGAYWVLLPAAGGVSLTELPRADGPRPVVVTAAPGVPLELAWLPDPAGPVGRATGERRLEQVLPPGVRTVQVATRRPDGARQEVLRVRFPPVDHTPADEATIRAAIAARRAEAGLPPLADVGAAPCGEDVSSTGERLTRTWNCWAFPANPERGGGAAWSEVGELPLVVGDLVGPGWDALGLVVDRDTLALQLRERFVALSAAEAAAVVRTAPTHAAATEVPAASAALAERLGTGLGWHPASIDALRDHVLSGAVLGSGGTTWFAVGYGEDGAEAVRAAIGNVDAPVDTFAVATRVAHTDGDGFLVLAAVASRAGR